MSFGNDREFIDYLQEKESSNKVMICPLLTIASVWATPEQKIKGLDCLKEECAGWDNKNECCLASTLVSSLNFIGCLLYDIKEKMPKEFQFREK